MRTKLMITMAALSLIFLNACSRSGGSSAPIQQTPAGTQAPKPAELNRDSSRSSQEGRSATGVDEIDTNVEGGSPTYTAPPAAGNLADIVYDPRGLTPEQIYAASDALGNPVVGEVSSARNGEAGERLHWSGSGQDSLRSELQRIVDSKTKREHVAGDKTFAKSINHASFGVDWSNRASTLALELKKQNGSGEKITFSGTLSNKLLMRSGDLATGSKIRVEAACMDLNGGCQTVYVKVQDASSGAVNTAHMILRTTEASIYTRAVEGFDAAKNREFDYFASILNNTVAHSGEPGSLRKLTLRTTEVINGSSSYKVEMGIITERRLLETLNIGGALVKPATDDEMVTKANVLSSSSTIADTIRNVSLIRNDGRGNLTLQITIRKINAVASEDNLFVTFARIHKPLRPLLAQ